MLAGQVGVGRVRLSEVPMPKVTVIAGVSPEFGARLIAAGVLTTDALLRQAATASGRERLAAQAGIPASEIVEWVHRADLMRIPGVGADYAALLDAAGVGSLEGLASRQPDRLHARLLEVNASRKLVRRAPPLNAVESWVARASEMPRIVET
jgi:predicted flap endonuclease-1-like 5' DNA nuclease